MQKKEDSVKMAESNRMKEMPVNKLMVQMGIPMILSMALQAVYNIVDSAFVGNMKEGSEAALNALTLVFPVQMLMVAVGIGTGVGTNALLARTLGQGNSKKAAKVAGNSLFLGVIIYAVCLLFGIFGVKAYISSQTVDPEVISMGTGYLRICCVISFGIIFFSLFEKLLQATGRSLYSTIAQVTGALTNIVLDPIMIYGLLGCPKLGVAGAAWATVISQGISGILCLVYIVKAVPILHLHKEDWRPSGHLLKIQLAVGIPMALQYSITAIGTMMVQTALNLLGSTQVAAFTAANKIEQIVTQAYVAMGTTMATYCAQNIGAGKIKRIRQGFRSITIMGSIYSVVVAAIIMTVGKYMTYLFLSGDLTEIMHSVDIYLKCVGTFFIPLTVVNVYRNGIQGMGYGLLPMMAGVAELVGRGVVAMIAAGQKSYFGVCMASPAAWILASALLIVMYYYVIHQNEKRFAKYADEE